MFEVASLYIHIYFSCVCSPFLVSDELLESDSENTLSAWQATHL